MKAVLQPSRIARDFDAHEEVFLARYGKLRSWALQLTEHDRERAEDLVHDAYIQFTFAQPDLDAINNLNGYLYSLLRNLHLSQLRRSTRRQHRTISIVDYDSAEIGLRAADPRERIRLQDQLREVCKYACMRKETSKAGSVLILRFLHGYYPREIAQVMRCTREAVEERLRVARSEARQYLENPKGLRFLGERTGAQASSLATVKTFARSRSLQALQSDDAGFARTVDEFLNELRRMIFDSRNGECLTTDQIESLYSDGARSGINHVTLAHTVSCPACLDELNRLLDLPSLDERFPTDTLGTDTRGKGGDGGGDDGSATGGGSDRERQRCRKAAREVYEHQPSELCVSVNGYLIAAQKVGSELNEQSVSISIAEPIDFVEILSEQEMRLLFLSVEDRATNVRKARVALSDDRALEATLNFNSPWPSLQVIYSDPSLAVSREQETSAKLQLAQTANSLGGEYRESGGLSEQPRSGEMFIDPQTRLNSRSSFEERNRIPFAHKWAALVDWLAVFYKHHIPTGFFRRTPKEEPQAIQRLIERIKLWRFSLRFMLRPETITGVLSLILIAALLLVRLHVPVVSASELLRRSTTAEEASAGELGTVIHRTINIEERRLDGNNPPVRSRVELWQSAARGLKLRRLYDERNHLVAGEWAKQDGSDMVYRRGAEPQQRTAPEVAVPAIIENGELWRLDASAATFNMLVEHPEAITVDERSNAYVLNYENSAANNTNGLLSASLTLTKANLHAIEQRLIVARNGDRREYRFYEAAFEKKSTGNVPPDVFQTEPELLPEGTKGRVEERPPGSIDSIDHKSPVDAVASPELEIEVTYLLNRIKANLGEQVSLTRTAGGALRVEALAENDARKDEILRALTAVRNNPAVKVEVSTVAEAAKHQQNGSKNATVREFEVANNRPQADAELRAYFSARLVGEAIDEEINRYKNRVMAHSRQALLRASALKKLVTRFSPEQMRGLAPEAQAKWLAMIREHATGYEREVATLRQELRPIFNGSSAATEEVVTEANLAPSADRLVELSYANDEAVRAAFTISADGKSAASIKSEQFWRSLSSAERLAEGIQHVYQK